MRRAGWRRASLGLALLAGVVATPAAAVAARTPTAPAAACASGSDGVTVVVDFAGLGGGVQIRCVTEPVSSGFDALRKAGFTFEGAKRFPGLLCRIDAKPGDDPCVNAPPPDRYWAYWRADHPGGAWAYSDLGAGNRTPPKGSVEGWAWSDGCTRQPQGAPCTASTTTTKPPSTTTTRGASGGSTGGGDGTSPSTDGRPGATSTTGSGGATTTSATGPDVTTSSSTSTPVIAASGGTAPTPGATGDEEAAAPPDGDDGGGGSPVGAIVVIVVILGLGGAAWWRRRRTAGAVG